MVAQSSFSLAQDSAFTGLQAKLLDYASRIEDLRTPNEVLQELHAITTMSLPLSVFGAARFPKKSTDWGFMKLGKSAFLHAGVPLGLWEEYIGLAQREFDPGIILARSSLAAFTWTELRHMCQPIGIDRWTHELALKYGMRDGFTCPVGGRWVVAFWSPRDLSKILTPPARIMIFAATSFVALRLEQLAGPDPNRLASRGRLTPREIAVLRLMSTGRRCRDVAEALGLGDETVRSHIKNAQAKLGVRNRTHAVAEALRQNLIP